METLCLRIEEEVEAPVISLAPEEDADLHMVDILLMPPFDSSSPDTALSVIAPSEWLLRLPYFATHLLQPSLSSPGTVRRLILHCACRTATHTYFRCLHLLKTWPVPDNGCVFDSVHEALEMLPVAKHLAFRDCEIACLEFLGAAAWSLEEEDAIRDMVVGLGYYPSDAIHERLDTSCDSRSCVSMLLHMLGSQELHDMFFDVARKYWQSSSDLAKEEFHRFLVGTRASYMSKLSETGSLPCGWFTVTKVLLEFTIACNIVCELADSQALSAYLIKKLSVNHTGTKCILTQAFEKVQKGVVRLSVSQRVELVKQYGQFGQVIKDASFNDALRGVIDTLPLNHPALLDLMKSNTKMGLIPMWFDRVLNRVHAPELWWENPKIRCLTYSANDVPVPADDVVANRVCTPELQSPHITCGAKDAWDVD